MNASSLKAISITILIALLGVGAMKLADFPLPWLLGPMFGCLTAALLGVKLTGLPLATNLMRTVLGVAVGASFTPEVAGRIGEMLLSVALIPFFIVAIGLVGYPFFRRVCGFDRATSYYAAMPGGLQDMLVFGQEAGGDVRALSLIHATRMLVIVSSLPFILSHILGIDLSNPPGQLATEIPLIELVLMAVIAIAGWRIAKRLGLFGASVLGPMILAIAVSLAGGIHNRPPAEAIIAAQFFIGLGVGVNYVGITLTELRRIVLAAIAYTGLSGLIAAVVMFISVSLGFAPLVESMLAFSPGGQAEMAVLAIVAQADAAFVISHHIVRITIVIIGAPLAFRFLR